MGKLLWAWITPLADFNVNLTSMSIVQTSIYQRHVMHVIHVVLNCTRN